MSSQYDTLIRIFEEQGMNTAELKYLNRGRTRPDLIGDNDIE
jgi:hypothetical protein